MSQNFKRFSAINDKYISVIPHSTHWIDFRAYRKYFWTNVVMKFVIISSYVVPHNTLTGEIHWLWYRITHCQLKYTGCGTVWRIARWNTLVLAMCYAIPRPVQPSNMSYGTTTSVFHLAMRHTVPQPVYFSWLTHCQLKYTGCGTAWHIFRWKALVVEQHNTLPSEIHWLWWYLTTHPMYFSWRCVIWYHDQYLSPGKVSCGTTTSAT
jgi:hypothetical protein